MPEIDFNMSNMIWLVVGLALGWTNGVWLRPLKALFKKKEA